MTGVSLDPRMIAGHSPDGCPYRLIGECGSVQTLLRSLRALGVTHIEFRGPATQEELLTAADNVWAAGLAVTLHGALPEKALPFAEACPEFLPLLQAAGMRQESVMITVHSLITGDDAEKQPASVETNRVLRLWSTEAERYGFRLALELNRDKKNGDPSVTCDGVLEMLEGTDPAFVGICFDFGHYYSNTKNDAEIPPAAFLSRVFHTHIHALENGRTHYPFGPQAALPLDAYVQALVRSSYSGVYNLELDFVRYPDRLPRKCLRDSLVALKGALYRAAPPHEAAALAVKKAAEAAYPAALQRVCAALSSPQTGDRFYSVGPSGQVFCVGGIHFAVDVAIRDPEAQEASEENLRALFEKVSVTFITHEHVDHFNAPMLRRLKDVDCTWVIGDSLSKQLLDESGLERQKVRLVRPGDVLEVGGITVEVFEGRHYDPDGSGTGVPSVMYLLAVGGKRIFLPADVRDYGVDHLPCITAPDVMLANVWLGRGEACRTEDGVFEEFCDYVAYYRPKKVFLGHLWEYLREPDDLWRWEHAGRVMDGLALRLPEAPVVPLQLFQCYEI